MGMNSSRSATVQDDSRVSNVFARPLAALGVLRDAFRSEPARSFAGQSIACVHLTRYCPVGCEHCFFQSKPRMSRGDASDALTNEGLDRLADFINSARFGYVLISGGGDPFQNFSGILRLIERADAAKFVIVTSGYWARSRERARDYLAQIRRVAPRKNVNIRLSYDQFHQHTLSRLTALTLLDIFEQDYMGVPNFSLRIKTLLGDPVVEDFLGALTDRIAHTELVENYSDSEVLDKINPLEKILSLRSGFRLNVGYSRRCYPNVKVDLRDTGALHKAISIADEDMALSEKGNSSIVYNLDGSVGLNFWINYNGTICTWENQIPGRILSIYRHGPDQILAATFGDPVSLAYIEKGPSYRNGIVNEVDPRAVLRAKGMNNRDYVGAVLLEEHRTLLYLYIRVIQQMIVEGRFDKEPQVELPPALWDALDATPHELSVQYRESGQDIVTQFFDSHPERQTAENAYKLLELIRCSHYDVTPASIDRLISFHNRVAPSTVGGLLDVLVRQHHDPHDLRLMPLD